MCDVFGAEILRTQSDCRTAEIFPVRKSFPEKEAPNWDLLSVTLQFGSTSYSIPAPPGLTIPLNGRGRQRKNEKRFLLAHRFQDKDLPKHDDLNWNANGCASLCGVKTDPDRSGYLPTKLSTAHARYSQAVFWILLLAGLLSFLNRLPSAENHGACTHILTKSIG